MSGTPDPRRLIFFLVFCAVSACHGAPKSADAVTPSPAAGPRVVLPSGAVYSVELARTPEEQAQGLMFRESLSPRAGMLFLFSDAAPHRFWMKNTMIPLDMIWMDHDRRIVEMSLDTPPCRSSSAKECPNYGGNFKSKYVLELNAGVARKNGLKAGDTLDF